MGKKSINVVDICAAIHEDYMVLGATDRYVTTVSPIDQANSQSLTFCDSVGEDGLQIISLSEAAVIICSNKLSYTEDHFRTKTLILVSNTRLAFIRVMQKYFPQKSDFSISPTAFIQKGAKIHPDVYIGPQSCIGKCVIGKNTIIHGNVFIYSNVKIGKNVVINAGTVIGADGLSYERNEQGWWEKFPQIGGVIIEDDVDIGSNVSIMKGTLVDTIIGMGTKIGHLCAIGHNVTIGKNCIIVTHSTIGGSCSIGEDSWISIGACIRNGINIGKNTIVGMGAVVTKDVGDNWVVLGVPATKVREVK